MRRFLFILICAALAAAMIAFIANMPGVLIIPMGDWQAEISLALFMSVLGISLLLFYMLILIARLIFIAPQEQWRKGRYSRARRKQSRAAAAHAQALFAHIHISDHQTAQQSALAEAKRHLPQAPLTYLLRLAAQPDIESRQPIYQQMLAAKTAETKLFGLLGLMYIARRQNNQPLADDFAARAKTQSQSCAVSYQQWLADILSV